MMETLLAFGAGTFLFIYALCGLVALWRRL